MKKKETINKTIHFSCKNCKPSGSVSFKNNVRFCFGFTKTQAKPKDFYRFCIQRNNNRNANDIMTEEVEALLMGLSQLLFLQRLKEVNKLERNYKK